jgi:hypothetical protein
MIPSFSEFVNEDNIKVVEDLANQLAEDGKPEFKDVTKEELQAIYKETDFETKKEKAIMLINSLSAKKEKEKLILAINKATTALAIDRIVTNIALVPFATIKPGQ